MIQLASTTQSTSAPPADIYKLWRDVDNWAKYDQGIEWAKLDSPFKADATYHLKPKGGPKVRATILIDNPPVEFTDVSHLLGAKLKFEHRLIQKNGTTIVSIVMTLQGPLSWLWAKILGKKQQADLEQSTANLIALAESKAL